MRLIDADELKRKYAGWYNIAGKERSIRCVETKEIDWMPTIDAAPVVHGKWTTKRTQKHDGEWYCAVCDYEPIVMTADMKYCPNCGARMDL